MKKELQNSCHFIFCYAIKFVLVFNTESEDSDDMSIDEIIRQARMDCNDPAFSPQKEISPGSGRLFAPGPKASKSGNYRYIRNPLERSPII